MDHNNLPRGVSIILYRSGRFAVSQRLATTGHPGLWQFAGGHVEPGESPLQAAQRELMEETALVVTPDRFVSLGVTGPLSGYNGEKYIGYRYGVLLKYSETPRRTEPTKATEWDWVPPHRLLELPMLQATKEYALFFALIEADSR